MWSIENIIILLTAVNALQHVEAAFETKGLLYPKNSETREVRNLDGIWNFVKSDPLNLTKGIQDEWFLKDLSTFSDAIPMPVPASYNDITEDQSLREHVGTVWYDTTFFVPPSWRNQKIWIRFGSVRYEGQVWINGEFIIKHEIGNLPFEAEITDKVKFGLENRLSVQCDNRLTPTTIPEGSVNVKKTAEGEINEQTYNFDFFNYAGIDRSVMIFTTPKVHIQEVDIHTDLLPGTDNQQSTGIVNYEIKSSDIGDSKIGLKIQIRNKENEIVASGEAGSDLKGSLKIENVKPWWPYLMDPEPGYMYRMEIFLTVDGKEKADVYRLKVGIRTLFWDNKSFLINGKPIYIKGFGKHEDSDVRGKGLDMPLLAKDFNLLKWIGANAYRTSHYPYSEESMSMADEQGIMIIDECPAVNIEHVTTSGADLLVHHKSSIDQMIHRDRNHPSVVMWSIANEPRSTEDDAGPYFEKVANFTKSLESTRPITAALFVSDPKLDHAGQYLDIISFNKYNGWYVTPGRVSPIVDAVKKEATTWHTKHDKPVLMTEYGADTIQGYHTNPADLGSEEYQVRVLEEHFKAFDELREEGFFIGEMIWNFADFMTGSDVRRVGGNRKGVFTRNRQPKASAHFLRQRYHALGQEIGGFPVPDDLFHYVTSSKSTSGFRDQTEL